MHENLYYVVKRYSSTKYILNVLNCKTAMREYSDYCNLLV